ncbi:MAG: Peptidase [Bradyrhizobium sp.]|nr:Peptidase [Bradyrhizobium sp.]
MKYAHILAAMASEYWAVDPVKLQTIVGFLAVQASGEKFSAEEIEARIAPQTAKAVARREGAVAIIPVRGVLSNRMSMMGEVSGGGGASAEALAAQLRSAIGDEGVKAIILDVDSPGGNVHGTDEVAALIEGNRGGKPIIAQVNANAASAAYWITASADEVVVTPSGEVGSIGVYTIHDDISAALEKLGVKKTLIGAGKFKGESAPFMPLSEEAMAYTQSRVDAHYSAFVDRVARGRNVSTDAVRNGFGQGRMVGAKEAVAQGMVDRIATMNETLARYGVGPSAAQPGKKAFATQREKRALLLQ